MCVPKQGGEGTDCLPELHPATVYPYLLSFSSNQPLSSSSLPPGIHPRFAYIQKVSPASKPPTTGLKKPWMLFSPPSDPLKG